MINNKETLNITDKNNSDDGNVKSEWVKVSERPPKEYQQVLVVHKGKTLLASHECGHWYGFSVNEPPTLWLDDEILNSAIKASRKSTNMVGLYKYAREIEDQINSN
jgi:hypothetical protein